MSNRRSRWIIMSLFGAICIAAIIALGVHSSADDDVKELKLVHVITRHGIRTPASTYPKDPYVNETFFPFGWGQLTNEGKRQLYNSGLFLRTRYNNFLGPLYSPDVYYSQSTDSDRTRASLQLVNAGLWPPQGEDVWGPLPWQPIPVHAEPLDSDSLLLVRRSCPQYHIELERVMGTEEVRRRLNESAGLFEYLAEKTGQKIENFDDVQDVYSTLTAEKHYNLTLPMWTEGYYPEKLLEPAIFSYILNAYTAKLNRLKGGVLLKKLLSDWKSATDGTLTPKERKFFAYGGHDSTITNILRTLQVWDPQFPVYAIMVLFELSRDAITGTYGLEIFLRNDTSGEPRRLTVPGCEAFCPLEKLVELTADVVPGNWEEECETDDPNYETPELKGP